DVSRIGRDAVRKCNRVGVDDPSVVSRHSEITFYKLRRGTARPGESPTAIGGAKGCHRGIDPGAVSDKSRVHQSRRIAWVHIGNEFAGVFIIRPLAIGLWSSDFGRSYHWPRTHNGQTEGRNEHT